MSSSDLILLITSHGSKPIISHSVESDFEFADRKNISYLTHISNVPHQVLIAYQDLYCSGSLIRSRIVVTAASCFVEITSHTKVKVKVGSMTMTDIGQVFEVLEVKIHEYFGFANSLDNDIALLMLKDHVKFAKNVKKIILRDSEIIQVNQIRNVRVCGWGSTNLDAQYTNRLLCSDMIVINSSECWELYKNFLSKSNFCVKYSKNYRLSDNGGSVVHEEQLVGLISYGANRDKKPLVALATNVTYLSRWIYVNVQRFLKKYCLPRHVLELPYSTSSEPDYSDT